MTTDFWIGLAAGTLTGTVTTWLTIVLAIGLGRILHHRDRTPTVTDSPQ